MNKKIPPRLICVLIGLASIGQTALASTSEGGGFDPTFVGGGRELVPVSSLGQSDSALRMIVLPSGKLLLGGTCKYETSGGLVSNTVCATQLLADGSYDRSFGPAGVGYLEFDRFSTWPGNTQLRDMIILHDGRIAVFGTAGSNMIFGVLSPTGTALDSSVGAGAGSLQFKFGGQASGAHSLTQQPDGKVLVAGAAIGANQNFDFAVERLLADLSGADTAFGNGGVQTVAFDLGGPTGEDTDTCNTVALQSDGKIVLAGYAYASPGSESLTTSQIAVTRLNVDGSRDLAFGSEGDGLVHYSASSVTTTAVDMKIDAADRIVLGGTVVTTANTTGAQWIIDRLSRDGGRDPTFNQGNPLVFFPPIGINGGVSRLSLTHDGIFAIGSTTRNTTDGTSYFSVARLNSYGGFDAQFGTMGRVYGSFTATGDLDTTGVGVAVTPGGLMVFGSQTQSSGSGSDVVFGLGRLQFDHVFSDGFGP